MPIIMIAPWIGALIAGLIGGFAKAKTSEDQVNRMNRYNDPRSQLQRLNAAGLPFAAFSQGQAGNQSSLPDTSGIGDSLGNYMTTRMQAEQMKLLKEQVRSAKAGADIVEYERDLKAEEVDAALNQGPIIDGISRSNAWYAKTNDYRVKELEYFAKENQYPIDQLNRNVQKDLLESGKVKERTLAELDKILLDLKIGNMNFQNETLRNAAKNQIIKTMSGRNMSFLEAIATILLLNKLENIK